MCSLKKRLDTKELRYIANILTDKEFDFSHGGLFNVIPDASQLVPDIPTLIIGWERTKQRYPEASIIEWKVSDGVYWTYGKYEKRDRFEENTKRFYDLAVKRFLEKVKYVFFDIFLESEERFTDFLKYLRNPQEKTVHISGNMLYICGSGQKTVIGLSLRDCDYLDQTIKAKIFSAIYNNGAIKLLKGKEDVPKEIKYRLKDRIYLVPYLFS